MEHGITWYFAFEIYWPLKGPELITSDDIDPFSYKDIDYGDWTSIASVINSTTIIMIGQHTVVCFNIKTNIWTDYPDFPYPVYTSWDIPEMLAIIVNSHKNRKRYAYLQKI